MVNVNRDDRCSSCRAWLEQSNCDPPNAPCPTCGLCVCLDRTDAICRP